MSIQIFILSSLMEESNYPYKLKKRLAGLQLHELAEGFTESKLYYHFESLRKQGLIEVQEILQEENRPDKQVFRITEKGRAVFPKKIYKLLEDAVTVSDMVVGFTNIKYVDRNKVISILENKLELHRKKWAIIASLNMEQFNEPTYQNVRDFMADYSRDRHSHTMKYLERLIQQVKNEEI